MTVDTAKRRRTSALLTSGDVITNGAGEIRRRSAFCSAEHALGSTTNVATGTRRRARLRAARSICICNVFEIETFLIGIAAPACTSWRATDNGWHGLAIPFGNFVVYACLSASLFPCWAASAGNPSVPYGGRCMGVLYPPAFRRVATGIATTHRPPPTPTARAAPCVTQKDGAMTY